MKSEIDNHNYIKRNFGPVYDANSKILILGSFPSVKSREAAFFYGHPQNRFWKIMAALFDCEIPEDISGKKEMLLQNRVALWDVIEECEIVGSSDSSIRNVVPVDIMRILNSADITGIYCNGTTSYKLFMKYLYPVCHRTPVNLPSTSPANAAWSVDRLISRWTEIIESEKRTNDSDIVTHEEKALSYFQDKFHCSQSVLAAYAEELGLTEEQALKIAYCFNSGMRKGEVCGACSGALLVLGMKYGQSRKDDLESRALANQKTVDFLKRFQKENGSYICNDLLGCDISTAEGVRYATEHKRFSEVCPKMVASAVRILEEILVIPKKGV